MQGVSGGGSRASTRRRSSRRASAAMARRTPCARRWRSRWRSGRRCRCARRAAAAARRSSSCPRRSRCRGRAWSACRTGRAGSRPPGAARGHLLTIGARHGASMGQLHGALPRATATTIWCGWAHRMVHLYSSTWWTKTPTTSWHAAASPVPKKSIWVSCAAPCPMPAPAPCTSRSKRNAKVSPGCRHGWGSARVSLSPAPIPARWPACRSHARAEAAARRASSRHERQKASSRLLRAGAGAEAG